MKYFGKGPRLQQGGDVLVQGTGIQLHQKEESIWTVLEAFRRFNDQVFSRKEINSHEIDDLLQDVRKWYCTYKQLRHGNP